MSRKSHLSMKPQPSIKPPRAPERLGGHGVQWPIGDAGPRPKSFSTLMEASRQKGK